MELIALIFFVWLIGCLFPGSGGGHFDIVGALACLIAGVAVCSLLFCAYWAMVAGLVYIGEWLGLEGSAGWRLFVLLGPIAIPMIIAGIVNGIAERRAQTVP